VQNLQHLPLIPGARYEDRKSISGAAAPESDFARQKPRGWIPFPRLAIALLAGDDTVIVPESATHGKLESAAELREQLDMG